jgi:hypothetical protein
MLEKLVKNKLDAVFDALGWSMKELDPHWKGKVGKTGSQQILDFGITDYGRRTSFME